MRYPATNPARERSKMPNVTERMKVTLLDVLKKIQSVIYCKGIKCGIRENRLEDQEVMYLNKYLLE